MKPFLKFAGGKSKLLPEIMKHVPQQFGTYYEPFIGGGALYFYLGPARAVIGDSNRLLTLTYEAVRDEPQYVIEWLSSFEKAFLSGTSSQRADFYQSIRAALGGRKAPIANEAARVLFLNRTCFNGLWRTNKSGSFNVPMGSYKNPTICDDLLLGEASRFMQSGPGHVATTIRTGDFEATCEDIQKGDFVYFDPPYVPMSETANFVSYTTVGFGHDDQVRLRDFAWELAGRGVKVLLSNSDTHETQAMYSDAKAFELFPVTAPRAINSKGSRRQPVGELLIKTRGW